MSHVDATLKPLLQQYDKALDTPPLQDTLQAIRATGLCTRLNEPSNLYASTLEQLCLLHTGDTTHRIAGQLNDIAYMAMGHRDLRGLFVLAGWYSAMCTLLEFTPEQQGADRATAVRFLTLADRFNNVVYTAQREPVMPLHALLGASMRAQCLTRANPQSAKAREATQQAQAINCPPDDPRVELVGELNRLLWESGGGTTAQHAQLRPLLYGRGELLATLPE